MKYPSRKRVAAAFEKGQLDIGDEIEIGDKKYRLELRRADSETGNAAKKAGIHPDNVAMVVVVSIGK